MKCWYYRLAKLQKPESFPSSYLPLPHVSKVDSNSVCYHCFLCSPPKYRIIELEPLGNIRKALKRLKKT